MAVLNPGDASKQMKETCEDLVALDAAHKIMEGDQTIAAALVVAEYRMQIAAINYVNSWSSQQVAQPPAVRASHRNQGGQTEQRPYSRTDVRPPNSGVSGQVSPGGVGLPIAPLNSPPQAPTVVRVPAAGHVQTAPGLPDAVVPQGAQLHPRSAHPAGTSCSAGSPRRRRRPPRPSPCPGWRPPQPSPHASPCSLPRRTHAHHASPGRTSPHPVAPCLTPAYIPPRGLRNLA